MPTQTITKENTTARKACTYKQSTIVRVYGKSGALLGYLAEPEITHQYGDLGYCKPWYQITREESNGFVWWRCTCKGSAVYGKRCKHIKAAMILCGELIEEVEPEVVATPKTTVEEIINLQNELYSLNPDDLQIWLNSMKLVELKELASDRHVKVSGKKAAYVEAMLEDYAESHAVDARIEALEASLKDVPFISPELPQDDKIVSEECPQDEYLVGGELAVPAPEPEDEQEYNDDKAEEWTEEAIKQIREAALPKYDKVALGGRAKVAVVVVAHATSIEANLAARGLLR